MPYLRRRRSYGRRRTTLRSRRLLKARPSYRRRVYRRSVPRAPLIVSKSYTNKLKYMDYFNFATGGVAAHVNYQFRHNSCRDPVYGVGGGSCTGFAELAALYRSYRVIGSRIRIWSYNTCNSPVIIGVIAQSSDYTMPGTASTFQQTLFERPDICRSRTLTPYTGTGMAHPRCAFSYYKSLRSLEGRKIVLDDDYTATSTSEPSVETLWNVCLVALDGAATSCTANVRVEITYYIKWLSTDVPTAD